MPVICDNLGFVMDFCTIHCMCGTSVTFDVSLCTLLFDTFIIFVFLIHTRSGISGLCVRFWDDRSACDIPHRTTS